MGGQWVLPRTRVGGIGEGLYGRSEGEDNGIDSVVGRGRDRGVRRAIVIHTHTYIYIYE